MVQIWYPADATAEGEWIKYHSDGDVFAEAYSTVMNLPKFLFTTFSYVKTHAIENATISNQESSYPHMVLLDQVEKLAKADPDYRFTGRMDMQNMGMFGHSFGGTTTT